jgi:hypothetical protein
MTRPIASRSTLRIFFTVLMYFGFAMFFYAYVGMSLSAGMTVLITGFALTVICGLCRCFFTEGDCADRHLQKPAP